ncbi:MAG: ATP-binding protein [Thermodesulfovibrio sp.]|nr:ATP-binding protein [Thermodesulfovibrio sp.]
MNPIFDNTLNFLRASFWLMYLVVFWYLSFWRKEDYWNISFKVRFHHVLGLFLIFSINLLFLLGFFLKEALYFYVSLISSFICLILFVDFYKYFRIKFYYLLLPLLFVLFYKFFGFKVVVFLSFLVLAIFFANLTLTKKLSFNKFIKKIFVGLSFHFVFLGFYALYPNIFFNFLATASVFYCLLLCLKELYSERFRNSLIYLVSFIGVFVVLILFWQKYVDSIKSRDAHYKEIVLHSISSEIKDTILHYSNFIKIISVSKELKEYLKEGYNFLSDYLTYLNATLNTELIFFVDKEGIVRAVSSNYRAFKLNKNVKFRKYFREASEGKTSVFIARGIYTGREDIRVATPVFNKKEILGVLVFQFPVSSDFIKYVEVENAFLMHKTGFILIGREDLKNRSIYKLNEEDLRKLYFEQIAGNDRILETKFKQLDDTHFLDESGKKFFLVKTSINPEWYLGSFIDLNVYERYTALFFVASMFLTFIAHNFAVRSFERMRERLLKTLEELEEKRISLDSMDTGVLYTDKLGKIKYANKEAQKLLGLKEDLKDKFLREVLFLKEHENPDFKIIKTNDEEIPVIYTESSLVVKGYYFGDVITIKDARELIHRQELQRKIEKLNIITKISSGIVHEFNNYLMVITGNLSILKEILKEEKYKKYVDTMLNSTKIMSDVLQEFEALSSDLVYKKEKINIESILRQTLDVVLSGSRINYSVENFSLSQIYADSRQIYRIFQNIILNAKQAMKDEGSISVKIEEILNEGQISELSKGKYILVKIEDTGPGIPEEYIDRIFEPFFTLNKKGRGLGLSIVKSLIEKLNGKITVESKIGIGTKFNIYFPVSD